MDLLDRIAIEVLEQVGKEQFQELDEEGGEQLFKQPVMVHRALRPQIVREVRIDLSTRVVHSSGVAVSVSTTPWSLSFIDDVDSNHSVNPELWDGEGNAIRLRLELERGRSSPVRSMQRDLRSAMTVG